MYFFFLLNWMEHPRSWEDIEPWNSKQLPDIFLCCFNTVLSVSQVFLPSVPIVFLEMWVSAQIIIYTFVCFLFFIRELSRKSEFLLVLTHSYFFSFLTTELCRNSKHWHFPLYDVIMHPVTFVKFHCTRGIWE